MTDFQNFMGAAKRLDAIDYDTIANRHDIGTNELHALTDVECRSSGFDRHGRPAALFEPHLFYRQLAGDKVKLAAAVKAGLAYKFWKPGAYPADSYDRIERARQIDETAALNSTSWGLGQILGENHLGAGFATPQEMVLAFMADEENQLEAISTLLVSEHIDDDLKAHRWEIVARVWNGPGYARQGYHLKLAAAFAARAGKPATASSAPVPTSDTLKAVQTHLRGLGYAGVGMIDGKWGPKVRGAVLAFRADHGMPLDPVVDDAFMAALMAAQPRPVAPERANATVADLRAGGSVTIATADKAGGAAAALGGLGGIAGISQVIDMAGGKISAVQALLDQFSGLKDTLIALGPWVIGGLGIYIAYQQYRIRQNRLLDHQTGKSAGPDGM